MTRARAALWLLIAAAVGYCVHQLTTLWLPSKELPNDFHRQLAFHTQWVLMSEDPFAFVGQFPHRLLSPFLAHLVGLDGERFFTFTELCSVLLLALVFHTARVRGARPFDALLVAIAIGSTGALQIYKVQFAGYVDNLGFALFLLALLAVRHTPVFWSLFLLNLLNHEVAFFFAPWFLFVRWQAGARWTTDAIALLAVGGLYFAWRQYVGAHATQWSYNAGYFLDNAFVPYTFAWLWLLAGVHWLVRFGPLLTVLVWHGSRPRPDHERWHTLLIGGSALGVFFFAYDVMRHSNLLFVPLLIASVRFLDGSLRARVLYALLTAGTIAVYWQFGSVFDEVTKQVVFDVRGYELIDPANRWRLGMHLEKLRTFVGIAWPTLALLALEIAAMILAGRWFAARHDGARGAPPGDAAALRDERSAAVS